MTFSLRAQPINKPPKNPPKGAIMIEPWLDCFGGPMGSKLRVNGQIVGEVSFAQDGKPWFSISSTRKWVAKQIAKWLNLEFNGGDGYWGSSWKLEPKR